jgi:hypothetical protein
MLENIKTLNYNTLTSEEVSVLIGELVNLPDDELTNYVNEIIDTIDSTTFADETVELYPSYVQIFNNEKIKNIVDKMLESNPF